ncbi:bifunctional oligoribonuclease/PAP phosphatase NrnA [uncultured Dokdonia sp.]|uniref:DHH family phosphoesterase n=1 Tax=uncultured Dokdonia sp. TaxID=575653 RepID=UPI0026050B82|nr:bifunctional oligoribonuclease/PAP phosphatase NrnA [uncultured Dokdonia sp.]
MNSNDIKTVKTLLETSKSIVIVPHKNPDGDAMGSTLALCKYLNSKGHTATVIAPNEYPHFLKWLPGHEDVIIYNATTQKAIEKIENADLIFTLDFNHLSRTGDLEKVLATATAEFIMIDHHQQPADYAVVTYSDTRMSSTCEMVYHFIDALQETAHIDADMASCLYTGIMTDTGSFRFPSTTAVTHEVIAKLIAAGADNANIHRHIYDTNSYTKLQLLGVALKNLKILPEYKTAYITLSQKELDDHNFQKGDTEGFVNYGLSLEGIIFAIIFIENKSEGIIKMSLRSIGDFSVNEFARTHYEGGGHTNAAGGKSDLSLEDTITQFISILPRYKDKL